MNLHGVDVALNEYACCECCPQSNCMVWMLLSMNMRAVDIALNKLEWCNVDVALNEFACCGCCSQ